MNKTVGLFSGQGSQYPGMGKSLCDDFVVAREVYECAEDILGFNLRKLSFEGDEEALSKTVNAQPAIFAHSVSAYLCALEVIAEPTAVAGHSLGEFAALFAAGAFSLEDGFRIIKARAIAMENASKTSQGSMSAVIGVDFDTIDSACKNDSGFVLPVNLNMPTQTVISGETQAVERVSNILSQDNRRAKVVKLAVNSAFHTRMMQPAAEEFSNAISTISFKPTRLTFFSNLTGDILSIKDYPEYFSQHMLSAVLFTKQVQSMHDYGIVQGIEFGPKKTVSTFVRKNNKAIDVLNVDTSEDLKTL